MVKSSGQDFPPSREVSKLRKRHRKTADKRKLRRQALAEGLAGKLSNSTKITTWQNPLIWMGWSWFGLVNGNWIGGAFVMRQRLLKKSFLRKDEVVGYLGFLVKYKDRCEVAPYSCYQTHHTKSAYVQGAVLPIHGSPLAGFINCVQSVDKGEAHLIDPRTGQDMSIKNCALIPNHVEVAKDVYLSYAKALMDIPHCHELLTTYGKHKFYNGRRPTRDANYPPSQYRYIQPHQYYVHEGYEGPPPGTF